jgi:two-component system response regulator AtoC
MDRERGIFIYTSEKMHKIKEIIDQVANTDVTVLVQGESGVGKEVVARSIHLNSLRRDKPFVKVNCAALPSELLESELFGYEKGAFTGAYRQKPGKFELANSGTIFLDEIVEMSMSLQAKLLQVLQDREFSRLGGKKDVRVDVRILVATNKNIEEAVKDGRFREDLYYRLNVVNITIPPLRERKEEIPIFVEYFLDKFGKKYRKKVKSLSDHMMKAFFKYQWSGNIRELENVIQRIIVLGNEKVIMDELASVNKEEPTQTTKVTPLHTKPWPSLKEVQREATMKAEAEVIRKALDLTNWNRKKAADLLNISYKALLYKIKECNIGKHPVSPSP